MYNEEFMRRALSSARAAFKAEEAPVGAVIVKDGKIISTGRNMREKKNNSLLHAEIVAVGRACRKLSSWRLEDCEIYITLEPCPMCMGAIINSRIRDVYFGAFDKKSGACGSVLDLNSFPLNHKCNVSGGYLREEAARLLSDFFTALRKRTKH